MKVHSYMKMHVQIKILVDTRMHPHTKVRKNMLLGMLFVRKIRYSYTCKHLAN